MTKEEDKLMKEPNNTEAPRWVVKSKEAILTALHVLVLFLTLVVHPPVETSAVRALP